MVGVQHTARYSTMRDRGWAVTQVMTMNRFIVRKTKLLPLHRSIRFIIFEIGSFRIDSSTKFNWKNWMDRFAQGFERDV